MVIQNVDYYLHTIIITINFQTLTNSKFSISASARSYELSFKPLLDLTNTKDNTERISGHSFQHSFLRNVTSSTLLGLRIL